MRIAITGGIGSGKSFFCRQLELRGVSVYDCDAAAKRLMASDESLKEALCRTVGNNCYQGGQLQKRVLAQFVLHSEANKRLIDSIVHPAVAFDFLHSGFLARKCYSLRQGFAVFDFDLPWVWQRLLRSIQRNAT